MMCGRGTVGWGEPRSAAPAAGPPQSSSAVAITQRMIKERNGRAFPPTSILRQIKSCPLLLAPRHVSPQSIFGEQLRK
jgi:hypothetical protein